MSSAITPHIRGCMGLPPGRMRSAARSGSTVGMVPANSATVQPRYIQNSGISMRPAAANRQSASAAMYSAEVRAVRWMTVMVAVLGS